jgi:hypothetical protein
MYKFAIIVVAVIGAFFLVVGMLLFYLKVYRGRKATEALILSSEVESFEHTDEGVTTTLFRSKYEVRYQVDGRLFTTVVRSSTGVSNRASVEAKLRNNPVGSQRPLYYLPNRPEDVELEPVLRRAGFSLIFVTVGLTILAGSALAWPFWEHYAW